MRSSAINQPSAVEKVDTSYLETLIGYNARRAALAVIAEFLEKMAVYDLKPVDFSVMSVIVHNPGVTSRQLCACLNILPPNLVGLIQSLDSRGLIERQPHPHDGRAAGRRRRVRETSVFMARRRTGNPRCVRVAVCETHFALNPLCRPLSRSSRGVCRA